MNTDVEGKHLHNCKLGYLLLQINWKNMPRSKQNESHVLNIIFKYERKNKLYVLNVIFKNEQITVVESRCTAVHITY